MFPITFQFAQLLHLGGAEIGHFYSRLKACAVEATIWRVPIDLRFSRWQSTLGEWSNLHEQNDASTGDSLSWSQRSAEVVLLKHPATCIASFAANKGSTPCATQGRWHRETVLRVPKSKKRRILTRQEKPVGNDGDAFNHPTRQAAYLFCSFI